MWAKLKTLFSRKEWSFENEIAQLEGQVWYLENKLQRKRSGRAMEKLIIEINTKRAQISDLKELKRLDDQFHLSQQTKGGK
jgi:hypothetical protein